MTFPLIRLTVVVLLGLGSATCSRRHLEATGAKWPVNEGTLSSVAATKGVALARAGQIGREERVAEAKVEFPRAAHVVIVSQDGMRPDALVAARAPVHQRLVQQGAYSATARTIDHSSTLPSHATMLSGFDESAHGLTWNSWKPARGFIRVPTIFSAARGAGLTTAAFVGKQKLAHIVRPDTVDAFSHPDYLCDKVAREAANHFASRRPALLFVHQSDPDAKGHQYGWMSPQQLSAVRQSDRCLGMIVSAIERAGVADKTLLIVSADHGGHGKSHHSRKNDAEDRTIPWLAWGAGVRAGYALQQPVSTHDTAATALWALGLPRPRGARGRVVTEAFGSPELVAEKTVAF